VLWRGTEYWLATRSAARPRTSRAPSTTGVAPADLSEVTSPDSHEGEKLGPLAGAATVGVAQRPVQVGRFLARNARTPAAKSSLA
jgi:hypothetical protein